MKLDSTMDKTAVANPWVPLDHHRATSGRQWTVGAYVRWGLTLVLSLVIAAKLFRTFSTGNLSTTPSSLVEKILLDVPDGQRIREYTAYYTSESHFPGQGREQAEWTRAKWEEFGILDTQISRHPVVVPYPQHQRLALLDRDKPSDDQLLYEAALVEDPALAGHASNSSQPFLPAFHSWAGSGNVTASYVFANFGSQEDFDTLRAANVTLEGNIAIIKVAQLSPYYESRHLSTFRGVAIELAYAAGLVGVVVYGDPEKDAKIVESNGYAPFPYGPARPATTIERGTLTSPELRLEHSNEVDVQSVSDIPSVPISYSDAIPLLRALNNHGPSAADLPDNWHGGGLGYKGISYNVGPTPKNVVLNLETSWERKATSVHNVVGKIEGATFPDEVVILGTHRDAWGPGAGDPGSGSSALNEVVRSFGVALKTGWRPRRTILFVSFEGEEVGQLGSQTWIPQHVDWLNKTAIAYINVVVAGSGTRFHLKASPLLYQSALHAMKSVPSPDQTVPGQTVADAWDGVITTPGGGDAISFTCRYSIASADFGFSPALNEPIFPYHSQFDTLEWMDAFGDSRWDYHPTTVKVWSLMAFHLLDSPILPVSVTDYAVTMRRYLHNVRSIIPHELANFSIATLEIAVDHLHNVAIRFDHHASLLSNARGGCHPWLRTGAHDELQQQIQALNKVYITFERSFYYRREIYDSRSDHVVFDCAAWHADLPPYPGLWEAFSSGNRTAAHIWVDVIQDRTYAATDLLEQYLSEFATPL